MTEIVRFRGKTTVSSTTVVGTTTAGSYVQITVAGNSSAIVGAEIATVSTLFARYRLNSLAVEVGVASSSTNRYWGVKYIGEDSAAPGVVTCLSLLDGTQSAVCTAPQVKRARLALSGKELASSGLPWRECDDSTEALGRYGELTVVQENAGSLIITFHWDISFADLASSGLHSLPPRAFRGVSAKQLLRLGSQEPSVPRPRLRQEEKEYIEVGSPTPSRHAAATAEATEAVVRRPNMGAARPRY